MKCLIALIVGAALSDATENDCPPHSTLKANVPVYTNMASCECDTGYEAFADGVRGCKLIDEGDSSSQCSENKVWIAEEQACKYAYLFHTHARIWLQEFTAADLQANIPEFKRIVVESLDPNATLLGPEDILPYSISAVGNIANDPFDPPTNGNTRIILSERESDTWNAKDNFTVAIGFAVRLEAHSMNVANSLADELKSDGLLKRIEAGFAGSTVSQFQALNGIKLHVWALSAEFYHPPPTVAERGDCTEDWQCLNGLKCVVKPADKDAKGDESTQRWCMPHYVYAPTTTREALPNRTGNTAAMDNALEEAARTRRATFSVTMDIGCVCEDEAEKAKISTVMAGCRDRFQSVFEPHTIDRNSVEMADFAAKVSAQNAQCLEELNVARTTHLKCATDEGKLTMLEFGLDANKKQAVQKGVADFFNVDTLAVTITKTLAHKEKGGPREFHVLYGGVAALNQYKREHSDYIRYEIEISTYDATETFAVHNNINDETLGPLLAAAIGNRLDTSFELGSDCVQFASESLIVTPHEKLEVTQGPTPAPTTLPAIPGSANDCIEKTVMEIRGDASFQYRYELDNDGATNFMDLAVTGARACIAQSASNFTYSNEHHNDTLQGALQLCNVKVDSWHRKRTNITKDCNITHLHEGGLHNAQLTPGLDVGLSKPDGWEPTPRRLVTSHPHEYSTIHNYGAQGHERDHNQFWINNGYKGDDPDACHIFEYGFRFTIAVPGHDMHLGNKHFDMINDNTQEFMKSINLCTSGEAYVPEPVTSSSTYLPNRPAFDKFNVNSLELTYVPPKHTYEPVPTPAPSAIDCQYSAWTMWSKCSVSCGTDGDQGRFRVIVVDSQFGGTKCTGDLSQTQKCELSETHPDCPQNCETSTWTTWGDCDVSCGGGEKTRTREITKNETDGGRGCPSTDQTRSCNPQHCPQDCDVSTWADWSDCSKECDQGSQNRTRTVLTEAFYGGEICPELFLTRTCNEEPCPVECQVSSWSSWGSCSDSCEGKEPGFRIQDAVQIRTRWIITPPQNGAPDCPKLTQSKRCALHPCGSSVCASDDPNNFPLTCTYENNIVHTHHVNDESHKNKLFMCYHNNETQVCTCLCWPRPSESNSTYTSAQVSASNQEQYNTYHRTNLAEPGSANHPVIDGFDYSSYDPQASTRERHNSKTHNFDNPDMAEWTKPGSDEHWKLTEAQQTFHQKTSQVGDQPTAVGGDEPNPSSVSLSNMV